VGGLLGLVVSLGVGVYRVVRAIQKLKDTAYGLCIGGPTDRTSDLPLTVWLHERINELAGRGANDPPLVFADLWGEHPDAVDDRSKRDINLELVTTSLTEGTPVKLPLTEPDRKYYFSPSDLVPFFPRAVIEHLVKKGTDVGPPPKGAPHLLPLPEAGQIPVVMAARMSLSFPILLSAVPLWATDRSTLKPSTGPPKRCWFSDGGISSNFPVHFFDALLPGRPTFALNLRAFPSDVRAALGDDPATWDPKETVYVPTSPDDDARGVWFELGSTFSFLVSIKDSMQNWRDNAHARLPGYRDRVAEIFLATNEGGLNLKMDDTAIDRIAGRGKVAANGLVERFARRAGAWDDHRFVRYLVAMAATEGALTGLRSRYEDAEPEGAVPYEQRIDEAEYRGPYQWNRGRRRNALELTHKLVALAGLWDEAGRSMVDDAPGPPRRELRIGPTL